jgi:hypothetical protein
MRYIYLTIGNICLTSALTSTFVGKMLEQQYNEIQKLFAEQTKEIKNK